MTQPALFVANYIIEYSNEKGYKINNLKLQKLLYFLNARSLVENNCSIFPELMQKWKYGPVVAEVYHEYKKFGAFDIESNDIVKQKLNIDYKTNTGSFPTISFEDYDSNNLDQCEKKLIEDTVDSLSEYEPFELVDITHTHPMWREDEDRINQGEKNISYDNEKVLNYFLTHRDKQIWKN